MPNRMKKIVPRAVTDDEVRFFRENGWVKLESLISEAEAGALLERLKCHTGSDATTTARPRVGAGESEEFFLFAPLSVHHPSGEVRDDLFYSFSHSTEMGALARRMLGVAVRYWIDDSIVKMPIGQRGGNATAWHQDVAARKKSPFDAPIQLNCWTSLTHNTASHGTMRFVANKYLSDEVRYIIAEHTVEQTLPMLEALGVISPPLTLRPGDASLHYASTLHCAPRNTTSELRWAHDLTMIPADARFSGTYYWPCHGVEGVEVGKSFPDHRYPVLT